MLGFCIPKVFPLRSLTYALKIEFPKRKVVVFQPSFFKGELLNFNECICQDMFWNFPKHRGQHPRNLNQAVFWAACLPLLFAVTDLLSCFFHLRSVQREQVGRGFCPLKPKPNMKTKHIKVGIPYYRTLRHPNNSWQTSLNPPKIENLQCLQGRPVPIITRIITATTINGLINGRIKQPA